MQPNLHTPIVTYSKNSNAFALDDYGYDGYISLSYWWDSICLLVFIFMVLNLRSKHMQHTNYRKYFYWRQSFSFNLLFIFPQMLFFFFYFLHLLNSIMQCNQVRKTFFNTISYHKFYVWKSFLIDLECYSDHSAHTIYNTYYM